MPILTLLSTSKNPRRGLDGLAPWVASLAVGFLVVGGVRGASTDAAPATGQQVPGTAVPSEHLYNVKSYKIKGGGKLIPRPDMEDAVYPYLGDYLHVADIEKARSALEKAYISAGYQTVTVEIPPQDVKDGVVTLQVVQQPVGRLRVVGSRYFLPSDIKSLAPSLMEGATPNFNDVTRDIVALNQDPDRQVTPALKAGSTPGTVDVDLNVKDKFPWHGNVELNNRYSPNTTPLRLNATTSYDNLWQLGHSLSMTYQVAPENPDDAEVFTGSYLARVPNLPWLSFLLYGLVSDSNVATVGNLNVAGKGDVVGGRVIFTLPTRDNGFFHSLSAGVDWKSFDEGLSQGGGMMSDTPITYYPFTATYSATWQGDKSLTQLNAGVTWSVRGLGSDSDAFDAKRFKADESFVYFKSDLSHTHDLWQGFQAFGKVQGQVADVPLVNSEQFSGGGMDTVRGYLESEVLGDNGVIGSFELRSPSLGKWIGSSVVDEWRVYGFAEGGWLTLLDPLPEQQSSFTLASFGVGTRIKLLDHLNGEVDYAIPLIDQANTSAWSPLFTFKVVASF